MVHKGYVRARPLVVGLATLGLASLGMMMPSTAAPAPSATTVTLTSGTTLHSTWQVQNDIGMSGPQGTATANPGLGVYDATYDSAGTPITDAFDDAMLFWVNNEQVAAPATWDVQADAADPTLNRVLTAGPTTMGSVDVTTTYRVMSTQQVLRTTVFLTNKGTTPVTVPVTLATNVGSDGNTAVAGSSSGDTSFSDADRWVVTYEDAASPDPVNTHVLAGPGSVAAPPTGTSMTVFTSAGTQGVLANYTVTIPAGGSRGLMFFNVLSDTNAAALSGAAHFNTNPSATDELLAGLSDAQRLSIVNWQLTGAQPDGVIRKPHSRFVGNNIYNLTAKGQTVRTRAHRGAVRTFVVRVYNDGQTAAAYTTQGFSSAHKVRVRYFAGGTNVTASMKSAGGLTFALSPGQYKEFRIKMKVMRAAHVGVHKFAKVVATSASNGLVKNDAVKAVLIAKR
ncbi:MAG TPA: hypothetical protein VHO29_12290 [Marmoricola sp.]|nr:hypothetical protein [Marmoricola sp.]